MGPFSIAGIGSILGGIGDLFGGDDDYQQRLQADNQREFAKMGIRWRVEDAKAAGLHPLAAIGAAGASYSPVIAAGDTGFGDRLSRVSESLRSMGQNTTRAQVATMMDDEREMAALSLRNAQLRNSLLEAQITSEWASIMGQPGNPPMPAVTGPAVVGPRAAPGLIQAKPSISISSKPGDLSTEAGNTPLNKRFDMGGGATIDLPSQAASESLESMGPMAAPAAVGISALRRAWHGPDDKPKLPIPAGYEWVWDVWSQSFKAKPIGGNRLAKPYNPGGLRGRH